MQNFPFLNSPKYPLKIVKKKTVETLFTPYSSLWVEPDEHQEYVGT